MFNEWLIEPYVSFITALIVLLAGVVVVKFFTDLLNNFTRSKDFRKALDDLKIDYNIINILVTGLKYLLYIIVVVLAMGQLGVTTVFIEMIIYLVIVSVFIIIILSLKDIILNASAGFYFSRNKQIKLGDKIKVNGFEGKVQQISLVNIQLLEKDGKVVIIPNSHLNNKVITKLK